MGNKQKRISDVYLKASRRKYLFLGLIFFALLIAAVVAIFLGTSQISLSGLLVRIIPSLSDFLHAESLTETEMTILLTLRLPRIVSAVLVGASMGVCGTIMQASTGNVMASPFTSGISSAAGLGAAIGIMFHPFGNSDFSIILSAFAIAVLNAIIVYGLTAVTSIGPSGMILTGVALNFLFSSINSLLQYIASDDQLAQIVRWSFGSLTGITWMQILIMAVTLLGAMILFMRQAWSLNVMASGGDETAKSLGVNAKRVRILSGVVVTIVAAVTISFVGVVGFVGIVAPHIARLLIGSEHRILIPSSALLGALLVLVADTIGRTVISPTIIPVGIVLSVVGAPIFIYLIFSQNRRRLY